MKDLAKLYHSSSNQLYLPLTSEAAIPNGCREILLVQHTTKALEEEILANIPTGGRVVITDLEDRTIYKRSQPLASNPLIPYSKRSLFQNPAIFMGIATMVVVLIIASCGLRILSNLQTPTRFEVPVAKKQ